MKQLFLLWFISVSEYTDTLNWLIAYAVKHSTAIKQE